MDGKYIGEQLRQAAELAGIPLERPLHTLRHSYARALRDDHAIGRPLIYAPTPRLLQLLDVATLEEAKRRMGVPTHYRSGGEHA